MTRSGPLPEPVRWAVQPVSHSGGPLASYLWETPQGTPPRGALLIAHGFGEYALRHAPMVGALQRAGYRVYAYDQRGHGESGGPRAVVDVRRLVQDHLAARETLLGLLGGDGPGGDGPGGKARLPLFAFGHSLGGLVTAASLLQDPAGVAGAILSSPALLVGVNEPDWLKRVGRVLARLAPALPVTALPTGNLSRDPEVERAYSADALMYHGRVPALTGISMLDVSEGLWEQAPGWQLPTLLLHGDADRLADVNGSRRFFGAIASADRTYHEVAGGYHELYRDTGREEALGWTLAWLDAHTASGASPVR